METQLRHRKKGGAGTGDVSVGKGSNDGRCRTARQWQVSIDVLVRAAVGFRLDRKEA